MPPTVRRAFFAAALTAAVACAALEARAAQYPGWGETDWVYASKRECCAAAIAIAQEYSAQACVTSGGTPRPTTGGVQRGSCTSEWAQDESGGVLWRCYGEAAIWCR